MIIYYSTPNLGKGWFYEVFMQEDGNPWNISLKENGDFEVQYPDNTTDSAPLTEGIKKTNTKTPETWNIKPLQSPPAPTTAKQEKKKSYADMVEEPEHYKIFSDMEVIDIIRKCLTKEEFIGYCKGNILKYRLRDKGNIVEDHAKSKQYQIYMQRVKSI